MYLSGMKTMLAALGLMPENISYPAVEMPFPTRFRSIDDLFNDGHIERAKAERAISSVDEEALRGITYSLGNAEKFFVADRLEDFDNAMDNYSLNSETLEVLEHQLNLWFSKYLQRAMKLSKLEFQEQVKNAGGLYELAEQNLGRFGKKTNNAVAKFIDINDKVIGRISGANAEEAWASPAKIANFLVDSYSRIRPGKASDSTDSIAARFIKEYTTKGASSLPDIVSNVLGLVKTFDLKSYEWQALRKLNKELVADYMQFNFSLNEDELRDWKKGLVGRSSWEKFRQFKTPSIERMLGKFYHLDMYLRVKEREAAHDERIYSPGTLKGQFMALFGNIIEKYRLHDADRSIVRAMSGLYGHRKGELTRKEVLFSRERILKGFDRVSRGAVGIFERKLYEGGINLANRLKKEEPKETFFSSVYDKAKSSYNGISRGALSLIKKYADASARNIRNIKGSIEKIPGYFEEFGEKSFGFARSYASAAALAAVMGIIPTSSLLSGVDALSDRAARAYNAASMKVFSSLEKNKDEFYQNQASAAKVSMPLPQRVIVPLPERGLMAAVSPAGAYELNISPAGKWVPVDEFKYEKPELPGLEEAIGMQGKGKNEEIKMAALMPPGASTENNGYDAGETAKFITPRKPYSIGVCGTKLVDIPDYIPFESSRSKPKLTQEALENLEKLHAEAKSRGFTLVITNAYRDTEYQSHFYNLFVNGRGNPAHKPNCAAVPLPTHMYGIAVDIELRDNNGIGPYYHKIPSVVNKVPGVRRALNKDERHHLTLVPTDPMELREQFRQYAKAK